MNQYDIAVIRRGGRGRGKGRRGKTQMDSDRRGSVGSTVAMDESRGVASSICLPFIISPSVFPPLPSILTSSLSIVCSVVYLCIFFVFLLSFSPRFTRSIVLFVLLLSSFLRFWIYPKAPGSCGSTFLFDRLL